VAHSGGGWEVVAVVVEIAAEMDEDIHQTQGVRSVRPVEDMEDAPQAPGCAVCAGNRSRAEVGLSR